MEVAGGGWTLVASVHENNISTENVTSEIVGLANTETQLPIHTVTVPGRIQKPLDDK